MDKRFSVSMCVYGGDNSVWFRTAVDSILNQSLLPAEIVLVVDGPVPEALDIEIKKCESHDLFKVIRLQENQGHGNARRIGLEQCTYELVALMDADDISLKNRFKLQIAAFTADESLDVIGGNIAEFIGNESNIVAYRQVPQGDDDIKQYIKKRCPFNQVTVMLKKSVYIAAGGYIDWYCDEDYYLWLRMLQKGARFANVPDILVKVRVGEEMYRRRGGWKYFKSEAKLQCYMLKHKIIGIPTYLLNLGKRLIVQVLLPNYLRGWVFQKFAREKMKEKK